MNDQILLEQAKKIAVAKEISNINLIDYFWERLDIPDKNFKEKLNLQKQVDIEHKKIENNILLKEFLYTNLNLPQDFKLEFSKKDDFINNINNNWVNIEQNLHIFRKKEVEVEQKNDVQNKKLIPLKKLNEYKNYNVVNYLKTISSKEVEDIFNEQKYLNKHGIQTNIGNVSLNELHNKCNVEYENNKFYIDVNSYDQNKNNNLDDINILNSKINKLTKELSNSEVSNLVEISKDNNKLNLDSLFKNAQSLLETKFEILDEQVIADNVITLEEQEQLQELKNKEQRVLGGIK